MQSLDQHYRRHVTSVRNVPSVVTCHVVNPLNRAVQVHRLIDFRLRVTRCGHACFGLGYGAGHKCVARCAREEKSTYFKAAQGLNHLCMRALRPILPHGAVQPYTLFLAKGLGSASYPSWPSQGAKTVKSEHETFDPIFVKNRRF